MKNNQRRTPLLRKRRADHLRARWEATLAGIIDISRALSFNLDIDAIWDTLHDHLNLSFDTTSFFVALYDYERDRLELPLVSVDGMRVHNDPIPVCGMSRAVMVHGLEFYVQDADAEEERLQSLGVERDEREPGRFARSWIGVPLRGRQSDVIGLVALQNLMPNSFNDYDLSLLMAIAAPLSLALDNMRLTETERERRMIAGSLMEIGQLAGALLDYDDVLERILDQLQRVVTYDGAAILLPASSPEPVLVVTASHDPEAFEKGVSLRYSEFSPLAQSVLSEQPVVVSDAANFALWWQGTAPDAERYQSWLIIPMIVQQTINGLIMLGKFEPTAYTQKDASSGFALARQGAIALETTRLQAQTQANLQILQQRSRRLASINRITSVITSSLNRDEVFYTTAQLMTELFEADHCGIVMIEEQAEAAVIAAEHPLLGNTGTLISLVDNATVQWLAHYGTAVTIDDLMDGGDPTRESLRQMGVQSSLIAPLIVRDKLIGSISIDMMSARRSFSAEECETLVTIAGQVAIAVSHANLYQDALAANRLRSAFLANISHELRTPLNAIIGYSDMLLNEFYGTLNPQQQDRVARVNTSGKHLLNLIDDVLDLSKLEAGQITLALRPVRASEALDEALETLRPLAEQKGLSLEVGLPPAEPTVRADPSYLLPILVNLIENAVKFTATGGVTVDLLPVRFINGRSDLIAPPDRIYVPEGDWLAIRVSDTGIGIRPEDREAIFESFRQADSSEAREFEGPGLGLAITRQLVELHEGYVWVDSTPGEGSRFMVLLPTVEAPLNTEDSSASMEYDGRPLLLVIDDDPADRKLMQDYLGEDYRVITLGNSVGVLDMARQLQPDMVITDVMMPDVSGWEVLRSLRTDAETEHIPVLVLSVLDQKTLAYKLGAANYLVKPVNRDTLRAEVRRLLEKNTPPGEVGGV